MRWWSTFRGVANCCWSVFCSVFKNLPLECLRLNVASLWQNMMFVQGLLSIFTEVDIQKENRFVMLVDLFVHAAETVSMRNI